MTLRSNIKLGAAITGAFSAGLITGWFWFGPGHPTGASVSTPENTQAVGTRVPATGKLPTITLDGPYASSKSRFSGALANGPDAIKAALDSVATPDERKDEINQLFNEAAYVASTTGDFGLLGNLVGSVSQADRFLLGRQLPTVFSKLGPTHDIGAKLEILDKVSVSSGGLEDVRRQIYQMEAMERYEEMKKEGIVGKLSATDFTDICRALGGVRIGKAFEKVADGGSVEAQRAAAAVLGRSAMAAGTMNGSREIGKLPPGIVRDEAVAELVLWLKQTGSKEEAQPWLDSITDEQAKARAAR